MNGLWIIYRRVAGSIPYWFVFRLFFPSPSIFGKFPCFLWGSWSKAIHHGSWMLGWAGLCGKILLLKSLCIFGWICCRQKLLRRFWCWKSYWLKCAEQNYTLEWWQSFKLNVFHTSLLKVFMHLTRVTWIDHTFVFK